MKKTQIETFGDETTVIIDCEIVGKTPLLMNSVKNLAEGVSEKKKTYDNKEEAEKVAYRNKAGYLMVPSRCLKASMLGAAAFYKVGRSTMKPIIAGCMTIEPFEIELLNSKDKKLKDYEIDLRPVVVNRGQRIMRARPCIEDWKLKFTLVYIETPEQKVEADIFRRILEKAGRSTGILDNRPQKYGENGTFRVAKFLQRK